MNKILYSIILNESVVNAIDIEAHEKGTTRSGLINEILANHVSVMTPQQQIKSIFDELDRLIAGRFEELVPSNSRSHALKTSLDYKYKPTVKYEFELSKNFNIGLGVLKVQWRSKSPELLIRIDEFVRNWTRAEKAQTGVDFTGAEYILEDGRFHRVFVAPSGNECTDIIIGRALYDYVRAFDSALKRYASGENDGYAAVEKSFASYLKTAAKTL